MGSQRRIVKLASRSILVSASTALLVAISACSSTTNNIVNASCGPGTTLVDGSCIADTDGATDANSSDSAQNDAVLDGDAADVATDAKPDVSDTSFDGSSPDDPCLTAATTIVNCSSECGGPTANCAATKCQTGGGLPTVHYDGTLPAVIRTPSHPGTDATCNAICGGSEVAFAMSVDLTPKENFGFRILVPPPWHVYEWNYSKPWCGSDPPHDGCYFIKSASGGYFVFATSDPAAPSRNIVLEAVKYGEMCP